RSCHYKRSHRTPPLRREVQGWRGMGDVSCDGVGRTVTHAAGCAQYQKTRQSVAACALWSYWSCQTLESNISAQGLCARQDVGYRRILPSCSILQDAVQHTTASSRCAPGHSVRPPCAAGQGTQDAATWARRVMASGDAQKVWFPEMIAMLRQAADPAMSVEAVLVLRDRLDAKLQHIRRTRQIRPAMMWCPHCQAHHRAAPPRVSVRATILALGRFAAVAPTDVQAIEKHWNRYRRQHQLDRYGQEEDAVSVPPSHAAAHER